MHLTDDDLTNISHVGHCFFSRCDGVSGGIYASLNCGLGSDDNGGDVTTNRARAMDHLDLPADALLTNYQVHSPEVVVVTEPWRPGDAPRADAMVTTQPGIALGILTADCAPVLFADRDARVVGAAHAGWRGALAGVLSNTLATMEQHGARRDRIIAAIGPSIAQASYEVSTAFVDEFRAQGRYNPAFFTGGGRDGHCQFDLPGFIAAELRDAHVGSVRILPYDTYAAPEVYFSYRRATHGDEPDYGRQLSAIFIRSQ